uniref:Uncharacterized protein n=1 Tax=Xenopus tropicalis TaxID=8364 RepID=A0A1B8Y3G6_XENTR
MAPRFCDCILDCVRGVCAPFRYKKKKPGKFAHMETVVYVAKDESITFLPMGTSY